MKKLLQKEKRKRKILKTFENKKTILKSLSNNFNLIKTVRWNSNLKMTGSSVKLNQLGKRCVLTGRKNVFNKHYNISRLSFLKQARQGLISGLTRSTW